VVIASTVFERRVTLLTLKLIPRSMTNAAIANPATPIRIKFLIKISVPLTASSIENPIKNMPTGVSI
jgi:hypothetical protein